MTNLITIRIKFPTGAQTYDYAAPANLLKVGDKVIVPATYGEKEVEVVEVLKSLSDKTTRGIVGMNIKVNSDDEIKGFVKRKAEVKRKVEKFLSARAYALAAEADPALGEEMKLLGLL